MKQEFIINSQQSRKAAAEAVNNITRDPLMVVTISEYKKDRSAAQNRLMWSWLTDASVTKNNEHAGNTKDWWHLFFKEHSLLNIYIRDNVNGTAETMSSLYEVKVSCGIETYNNMKKFIVENISTTDADVAQFTEYLQDIERFCNSVGISLRTDSNIYNQAMGIKC
jgi:hypothetical protein